MSIPNAPMYYGKMARGLASAFISSGNTNRDGTGTLTPLYTASGNGGIVLRIAVISAGPIGTAPSTGNVLRFWVTNGTITRMLAEFTITSPPTPSATAKGFDLAVALGQAQTQGNASFVQVNWQLAPAEILSATLHTYGGTGDEYHITAEIGDYTIG